MRCRACGEDIVQFFSLGPMPLVNSFLRKNQFKKEKKYDLSVGCCPKCSLIQLMESVSPDELFTNYLYFSSTSSSFLEHCRETARYLKRRLGLNSRSLVLEIASNDGSQLQCFKDLGIQVLGIDPANNVVKVANERGIKTIPEFFNYKLAKSLATKRHIKADIVFGANILAHVPQITDFLNGVKLILKPKGSAVFEFPYIKGLFEKKFDIIYHEHVFYYSMLALRNLFQKINLEIYDVGITPMQGGSLRIFASYPGEFHVSRNVKKMVTDELRNGFDRIESYQKINIAVNQLKKKIITLLKKIKSRGKIIAAYSASAKGNILLNYFGINNNYLDFIVDKAKAKQGLYTPGTHLRVYSPDKIYKDKPDYLLILCWNIADEIIKEHAEYKKSGGKFIIPIPELKII